MNLYPDPASAKSDIRARLGSVWRDYDLDNLLHLRWLGFKPAAIYDIGSGAGAWAAMAHQVFPEARIELFVTGAAVAGGPGVRIHQLAEAPVHRLGGVIARLGLPAPDLLRLDTGGSEVEILDGAGEALASVSVVFVTGWLTKAAGPDTPLLLAVANRLDAAGFDLFAIGGGSRDEKGVAQTKDAVFVRRGLDILATHPPACARP